MNQSDFDAFTRAYHSIGIDEVRTFYNRMCSEYPQQAYYSPHATVGFFSMPFQPVPMDVLELGGWDGAAASMVLSSLGSELKKWTNYEIADIPRRNPSCHDIRYSAPEFSCWPWMLSLSGHNVVYLSHVVEHIMLDQLLMLLEACNSAKSLYIEAPLHESYRTIGTTDGHVLECRWDELEKEISVFGWLEHSRYDGEIERLPGTIRWYTR